MVIIKLDVEFDVSLCGHQCQGRLTFNHDETAATLVAVIKVETIMTRNS